MQLAELVQKLRTKKQAATKTAFQAYMELVTELAKDAEVDHDEAEHILKAASKSFDDDLPRNVTTKKERFARRSTMDMNRQALQDRANAEAELQRAQQALQETIDRLMPAVNMAHDRLKDANHRALISMGAENWLADPENILDSELLARESAIVIKLREVASELKPLVADREHRQSSLMNAELNLRQLLGRNPDTWPGFGMINPKYWSTKDIKPAEERVADLKNQVRQLDEAIRPRQIEQSRLQRELDSIHAEKLKP